jgi:hypothetical protein
MTGSANGSASARTAERNPAAARATEPATGPWTPPAALDAAPAGVPMPQAPAPARGDKRKPLPNSAPFGRNAYFTDRFTETGQNVTYPFVAGKGELSLFELAASGYERAASSSAKLEILDANGRVLWDDQRGGGSTWRVFWSFVAPAEGEYRLSMTTAEGSFRYVLVRHSNYAARKNGETLALDGRALVHSYLADSGDRARFTLECDGSERIAIKLLPTREEARTEMRSTVSKKRAPAGTMQGGLAFQTFQFTLTSKNGLLSSASTFALVRPPKGELGIEINALHPGDGGLFDLEIVRSPPLVELDGVVVDRDDLPLASHEIEFLREPDRVGSCATGPGGRYEASVLPGELTIRVRRKGGNATHDIHVHVDASQSIDLLVPVRL